MCLLWTPAQRSLSEVHYILPVFFYYFLWPPYSSAQVNGGSRNFYKWWILSVIIEVTTWIFSWSSLNYRVGQKVTKFGIFLHPTRKLSALPPELRHSLTDSLTSRPSSMRVGDSRRPLRYLFFKVHPSTPYWNTAHTIDFMTLTFVAVFIFRSFQILASTTAFCLAIAMPLGASTVFNKQKCGKNSDFWTYAST